MSRPLRIEFPGAIYHITSRGNSGQKIFLSDGDRKLFLRVLSEALGRYCSLCHAFCLMNNHYHLIIETGKPNLARLMRWINGVYTQRINRKYKRTGHIFQGRYKAFVIDKDRYLLAVARYIVQNPVRAGVVSHPAEYRWSSYPITIGPKLDNHFLFPETILSYFSSDREKAKRAFAAFVCNEEKSSPFSQARGIFLGVQAVSSLSKSCDDFRRINEIPKEQRYVRPSLDELFGEKLNNKNQRNLLVVKAHSDYGYTMSQIGKHLGLHYTSVSKIVKSSK